MNDNKSSPDWWARVIGAGGLAIALGGLYLSHRSLADQAKFSEWQRFVQQESLREKLQDNVALFGGLGPKGSIGTFAGRGDIRIEIVNVGQPKIYVKGVDLHVGNARVSAAPIGRRVLPIGLEPGMNADFRIRSWNFGEHPLSWKENEKEWEPYNIIVETTKDSYELEGHTTEFGISSEISGTQWGWDKH